MRTRALLIPAVVGPLLAAGTAGADEPKPTPTAGAVAATETTARATLDRWLAAQNHGQVDAYAALYAPNFAGIKRVGKTAKKMNRAAWLKDRKAMFKARLEVSARDIAIVGAPGGATITYTQTWVSGSYGDVGPKRIVLDASNTAIVAEELLSSRPLLTDAACANALYPGASLKRKVTGAADGERPIAGVTVSEVGERWACKVEVRRDDGTEVALGVLAFGKRWEVKGRLDFDYDVTVATDPGDDHADGEVDIATRTLHPRILVVEVSKQTNRGGPQYDTRETHTTLYRADGDELIELLAWQDGGTSGESDDSKTCELTLSPKRVAGWPDLTLVCTSSIVAWAAGETEPRQEQEVTRYRWDGSTYAER